MAIDEAKHLKHGVPAVPQPLTPLVQEVAALLNRSRQRVVFAESCTAGLVAASLARVPGISEYLCGSAVVYRLETKSKWLDIPAALLDDPGPVSNVIASLMAERVLALTPEADFAVSITGHLGPNAPSDLDGVVYVGVARREVPHNLGSMRTLTTQHQLPLEQEHVSPIQCSSRGETIREVRQWAAVALVLTTVRDLLHTSLGAGL